VPSAGIRFAGEAAFLVLVALGLGLAQFDPIVIGVGMLLALVLVALFERAVAKEAARMRQRADEEPPPMPPPPVEGIDVEPVDAEVRPAAPEPKSKREPHPEVEPAVDERSARAILASGPPPADAPKSKQKRVRRVTERRPVAPPPPPPPSPPPEPVDVAAEPPREWNLWELQRAARDTPEDERREEWSAILIHLREFANADGDLPIEFDGLVRESFAVLLAAEREPAAAP
jgi:hypothetical protein